MPVLSAKGLSKAYGSRTLFEGLTLTLRRGEKVGLLGVNGTGKSTLLKILAGREPADTGTLEQRRGSTVLLLEQEPALDPEATPLDLVEAGLTEWKRATSRHAEVSAEIELGHATPELLEEQATLAERVEQLGGWSRGHIAREMLERLGITDVLKPAGVMSGGERRRVALAQVLVASPDLAILDEPTNHLDVETVAWLETYLAESFPGTVLLVSHDRYVLDAVCDRMLELDRGGIFETTGGYAEYLEQKAERLAHEDRAEQNRMNLIRRERAWLMRGAKARTTKQKARIQRALAVIAADPTKAPAELDLSALPTSQPRLGGTILDIANLDLEIGGKELIRGLTMSLVHGDRLGIVGKNGSGKTSLVRAIMGELAPSGGVITVGKQTKIALFDQARAALVDEWSVLDNIAEREGAERTGAGVVKLGNETIEVRSYLERFLFDVGKQRQKVGALSGGERARVALAKVLKSGANLLILDEPTNDLDVATLGSLEELLLGWHGCVILVSHDRALLDRVATSTLAFLGDGRVVRYAGGWTAYREKLDAELEAERAQREAKKPGKSQARDNDANKEKTGPRPLSFAEKRELEGILDRIAAAEGEVSRLETKISDPSLYTSNPAEAKRVADDLTAARASVEALVARWEELESRRGIKS
ncbi:MAG: ABC-F family ATP-binding cassette domain-containing protein [Polyangiaceae bacterium]